MVVPELVSKTARIEKRHEDPHPKPCTKRFGPINEGILTGAQRQLLPLFSLQRSSRFLFARGVLLVEGVGDEHLFTAIARRLRNFDAEANEVAIVEAGGKDKLVAFSEILRQLGLATWMLTDIDFLWGGAGAVLGADPNLAALGEALKRRVPEVGDGSEAAQRSRKQRLKEVCIGELVGQRDLVCDALLASGIFVLRHGEIEDYVGLGQNAKGQYLKAANEVRSGIKDVQHPEDFERLLDTLQRWAGE
jgi:hypothetical protein